MTGAAVKAVASWPCMGRIDPGVLEPPPHSLCLYSHCLFIARTTEGVLVAKKDFYAVWTYKSPEGDKDISLPNLEVINLLKSLKSSGYVKETFNWCVRLPACMPALAACMDRL